MANDYRSGSAEAIPAMAPIPDNWINKHNSLKGSESFSSWEDRGWLFVGEEIALGEGNREEKKTLLLQRAMGAVEQKLNLREGIILPVGVAQSFYKEEEGKLYCLYCIKQSGLQPAYFKTASREGAMDLEREIDYYLRMFRKQRKDNL